MVAVIVTLVKIVEKLVDWGVSKFTGNKSEHITMQLDPETARAIHETNLKMAGVADITTLKDHDGVPMVYCLRSIPEDLRQTAILLRDISYTQQRLLDRLEALDDRVEDVQSTQRTQNRR